MLSQQTELACFTVQKKSPSAVKQFEKKKKSSLHFVFEERRHNAVVKVKQQSSSSTELVLKVYTFVLIYAFCYQRLAVDV